MSIRIVNLTPHVVHVQDPHNPGTVAWPASGEVARLFTVSQDHRPLEMVASFDPAVGHAVEVGEIPVTLAAFGPIEGLPDPRPGVAYIVSLPVAQAAADLGRGDVYAPGELIRDADGRPVACAGLRQYRSASADLCTRVARLLAHLGDEHHVPLSAEQLRAYLAHGQLPAESRTDGSYQLLVDGLPSVDPLDGVPVTGVTRVRVSGADLD